MPHAENRPTRSAPKAGSGGKSPSRLVLRSQGRPKKVLENTVNNGNTTPTPRSFRSFPSKFSASSPKRIRPSILPKYQSKFLTPPGRKKVLETIENSVSTGDLETRIRNALAASGRRRADSMKVVRTDPFIISYGEASRPGSVKSVKWDPAIVFCADSSRARSTVSEDTVPDTAQKNSQLILQSLQDEDDIDELFNTLVRWKKKDPRKIQRILEELRSGSSDGCTTLTSVATPAKTNLSTSNTASKKLNPSALPFSDLTYATSKTLHGYPRSNNGSQLHVPKKRLSQSLSGLPHNLQSPIWINTGGNFPPQIQTFKFLPHCVTLPILQPLQFNPYRFVSPPVLVIPQEFPLPSEDEHGRVAYAIDAAWAEAILEKFVRKYPLTGMLKAKPPPPAEGRYAAEIQQRLEYLLMQEKEKRAFEQLPLGKANAC